jgi:hypothetical protein
LADATDIQCRMSSSLSSSRLRRLYPWIGIAIFSVAAWLVYRALRQYSVEQIVASLGAISLRHLALGGLFAAGSYLCKTGNDLLAVRYTGSDLAYPKVALASFTALSIGQTLGVAAFSSGAVRYRFYSAWGLSAGDVARILVFCGLTVLLGLASVAGIACLLGTRLVGATFGAPPLAVGAAGVLLLTAIAGYLGLAAVVQHPIRIRRFVLPLPPLRLALGQVALGTVDFMLVAAVLHQMLSASSEVGFFAVAAGRARRDRGGAAGAGAGRQRGRRAGRLSRGLLPDPVRARHAAVRRLRIPAPPGAPARRRLSRPLRRDRGARRWCGRTAAGSPDRRRPAPARPRRGGASR